MNKNYKQTKNTNTSVNISALEEKKDRTIKELEEKLSRVEELVSSLKKQTTLTNLSGDENIFMQKVLSDNAEEGKTFNGKTNAIINFGENKYDKIIYYTWRNMLDRCYDESNFIRRNGNYADVRVCKEWFTFSNFYNWAIEKYKSGYSLDKDLLQYNNTDGKYRYYSPQTCCFIPQKINTLLRTKSRKKELPMGVSYNKSAKKYMSYIRIDGKLKTIGYFKDYESAFKSYATQKKNLINDIADEFYKNGLIDERVYNSLNNYVSVHYN